MKKRTHMTLLKAFSIFLLITAIYPLPVSAEEEIKEGAKKTGKAIGSAIREIGQSAKKIGKKIGHGAKDTGKAIGSTAKEGGKELKKAVKGEKDK